MSSSLTAEEKQALSRVMVIQHESVIVCKESDIKLDEVIHKNKKLLGVG